MCNSTVDPYALWRVGTGLWRLGGAWACIPVVVWVQTQVDPCGSHLPLHLRPGMLLHAAQDPASLMAPIASFIIRTKTFTLWDGDKDGIGG
jgi:hypothetical protein